MDMLRTKSFGTGLAMGITMAVVISVVTGNPLMGIGIGIAVVIAASGATWRRT